MRVESKSVILTPGVFSSLSTVWNGGNSSSSGQPQLGTKTSPCSSMPSVERNVTSFGCTTWFDGYEPEFGPSATVVPPAVRVVTVGTVFQPAST